MARQFWESGRLTLEHWLIPRLRRSGLHHWPSAEVVELALSTPLIWECLLRAALVGAADIHGVRCA